MEREIQTVWSERMFVINGVLASIPSTVTGTIHIHEGWNFNSGNYLFTTDTK